jgi:pyrroloquinoline quinone biosynthesis protein D
MSAAAIEKPRLATGVRLAFDKVRDRHMLLFPEGAVTLNETAVTVLELCDGTRTLDEIAAELGSVYNAGPEMRADVEELIAAIASRGLVVDAAE